MTAGLRRSLMMEPRPVELSYDILLKSGQAISFPQHPGEIVGPGHWIVSIRPADSDAAVRDHSAFLDSYAPEDEGLYDDYSSR
jgi:hypothetical protein